MQYCVYKTRSVWLEIRARYKKSSVITVSEHRASRGNYLTVIGYKEVRDQFSCLSGWKRVLHTLMERSSVQTGKQFDFLNLFLHSHFTK